MAMERVDIYHFNDLHRHLGTFPDGSGGAARLATLLEQARAEHPDALVANLGDVAGDNTAPGKNAFRPIPDLFNAMDVDVLELGNHEFEDPSKSYATLREGLIAPLHGDVLCANVREKATGQPLPGTRPYTIRDVHGVHVALIGVVTRDLASAVFPAAGAGLSVAPIEDTLQELVPRVRAEGADAVVVLAHEGLEPMRAIAERVDGIDVILAAHDHRETHEPMRVENPAGGHTLITEAGGYGRWVGHVRLDVDPRGKRVAAANAELLSVGADLPADPAVQKIVDGYRPNPHVAPPPRRKWEKVPLSDLKAVLARQEKEDAELTD